MAIGSRGAKGSIKDRLISMLYRNRYNKLKLQKKSYKLKEKERERDYIVNLLEDKVSLLEKPDQEVIHFTVTQNFQLKETVREEIDLEKKSKKIVTTKQYQPVGIPTVLENSLNRSLPAVNLKKEKKKVESEITIIKEIDKFVKDNKPKLDNIKRQLDSIKDEIKQVNTLEQNERIKKRYNKIHEELVNIKKQYEIIAKKYNFEDYDLLNNLKLIEAKTTFKDLSTIDELEIMVSVVKDTVEQLNPIEDVKKDDNKVRKQVIANEEYINKKEAEYYQVAEKYNKYNDINDMLKKQMEEINDILNSFDKRVDVIDRIVNKETKLVGYDKLLKSFLKIAAGVFTVPIEPRNRRMGRIVLGTALIERGLHDFNNSLTTRETTTVRYVYEDLEENIKNSKDQINDLYHLLTSSYEHIKNIKENFKIQFAHFKGVDKYDELLYRLELLEKTISSKQRQILIMNGKIDDQYHRNKVKMKKLQAYKKGE